MVNYNDGEWHGWNGGDCPVHPRSQVEIVWRSTESENPLHIRQDSAVSLCFEGNIFGKIIAFRVVKEHREPREVWLIREDKYSGYIPIFEPKEVERMRKEALEVLHFREITE